MNIRDLHPEDEHGHEPPNGELLAAEYVLGIPDAVQRRDLQARIGRDPDFAARVAAWERHFGALLDEIAPASVPAHLWPRIRARLGWPAVEGERQRGLWHHVGFWRGAAGVATAAAIALVFVLRMPRPVAPPPPVVIVQPPAAPAALPVTTLARDNGSPAWLASIDAAHGTVLVVPVPTPADAEGRVPELWVIPPGEAPRSLGLVSTERSRTLAVPKALLRALAAGSTLAVSLEPPGGAPHGVPTGPITATGKIEAI